jgi:flagellar biosynthetic protein FliO
MNALKNCSDIYTGDRLFVSAKKIFFVITFLFVCLNVSAAEPVTTSPSGINMSDYFKVMFGLVFVIALFLLSTFLFKRFGQGPLAGRGQMRLIDALHLSNRERLVLVELKDKQILLSITPGQINKLDTIDMPHSEEKTNA